MKQLECDNYQRKLKQKKGRLLKRPKKHNKVLVDSGEFTPIEDSIVNNTPTSMSRVENQLDEEEDETDNIDALLAWARNRTANPVFDQEYNGLVQDYEDIMNTHSENNQDKNDTTISLWSECKKDSNYTFVLGDTNHTCCDLTNPNLRWGCKQERLFKNCPYTCNTGNWTVNNTGSRVGSKSPSSSPTIKPRPRWNPFWPRIINSIHFYGYGGSLTEPPCSEWVAWRVLDTPMQISYEQWDQMRNILFNQVDEMCHRTSAHWEGSVARPTQSLNERPLWKCSSRDYVSDVEKRKSDDYDD